jgi:cytochrome c-type biogenesis protein CcmH/NrfG
MRARSVAVLLIVILAFYALVLGDRGWTMVRDGRPAFVLLGLGVLLLPLLGVWVVWQEVRFGRASERLGRELAVEGGLPADELPRRTSGRIDREAADAVFAERRREVEAAPEDWRSWFRLALAYGDAGDSARGRRALRRAVRLHDAGH